MPVAEQVELPAQCFDDGPIGVGRLGIRIGQIVASQEQSPGDDRLPVDPPEGLQVGRLLVLSKDLGRDAQQVARLDEPAIAHVSDPIEHDHTMGKILAEPNQPSGGLGHRLERQDAGHHRETGKVLGQILLGIGQTLHGRDVRVRFQLDDLIDEHESHGRQYSRTLETRQPRPLPAAPLAIHRPGTDEQQAGEPGEQSSCAPLAATVRFGKLARFTTKSAPRAQNDTSREETIMYLSRFGVKNYKCLGEIDIPLTPIHVFIGENDAGKTSLLEAMEALCASSEQVLTDIFPKPWEGRELVYHGSQQASVELSGQWEPSEHDSEEGEKAPIRYGFTVDFPLDGVQCKTPGDWVEAGPTTQPLVSIKQKLPQTAVFRERHGNPLPQDETIGMWCQRLTQIIRRTQKYSFNPRQMAMPAAFDKGRRFRMDPDGFGLATLLDDLLGHDRKAFTELEEQYCSLFPQFTTIQTRTEIGLDRHEQPTGIPAASAKDGKAIYLKTRSGKEIRAQRASDGAILFLGLLALAYLPEPPKLLLLEEPENGIYPKRLGQVLELLKQLVSREEGIRFPQIIMTTHSPYVLSFFEPEQVTFLSRPADQPNGPVRARPLRDAPNIKERMGNEFFLGELWYNLSEEELFGDE